MHSKTSFGKQDLSFVNHLSLRMVTALFNAALLTANWTVVDCNRTWIACDEGSSGTIAGWQQVRFRTLAVVTWHPVTDQGPTPLGPEDGRSVPWENGCWRGRAVGLFALRISPLRTHWASRKSKP